MSVQHWGFRQPAATCPQEAGRGNSTWLETDDQHVSSPSRSSQERIKGAAFSLRQERSVDMLMLTLCVSLPLECSNEDMLPRTGQGHFPRYLRKSPSLPAGTEPCLSAPCHPTLSFPSLISSHRIGFWDKSLGRFCPCKDL